MYKCVREVTPILYTIGVFDCRKGGGPNFIDSPGGLGKGTCTRGSGACKALRVNTMSQAVDEAVFTRATCKDMVKPVKRNRSHDVPRPAGGSKK